MWTRITAMPPSAESLPRADPVDPRDYLARREAMKKVCIERILCGQAGKIGQTRQAVAANREISGAYLM